MGERRKIGRADSPHASVKKINKLSPEFVGKGLADFAKRGGYQEKVVVDTEELLTWANERGQPVNGESRSQCVGWLAREKDKRKRERGNHEILCP